MLINEKKKFMSETVIDVILMGLSVVVIAIVVMKVNWIASLDGDNAPQTYAVYTLVGKALHSGELPLWNPYIWGGINNIGAPISEAFYPINWFLCYIFYDVETGLVSYAIIAVNLIIHISLYFVGMYFLLKKLGIKSLWALLLSALSICCSGFVLYLTWIVFFDGFTWFPLLTLFAIKLIEEDNKAINIVILGIIFALEASISVSLMLVITTMFIVALFVTKFIMEWKRKKMPYLFLKLGLSGALGILLSLPVILCTIHFLANSARYVDDGYIYGWERLSFETFTAHDISLSEAKALFTIITNNTRKHFLAFGGILFVLCLLGIFGKRKKFCYVHKWCVGGLIFSLLYCVNFVVTDFVYYIPFLNSLRETYMYGCVVGFLMTILAGYGIVNVYAQNDTDTFVEKYNFGKGLFYIIVVYMLYNLLPHQKLSFSGVIVTIILLSAFLMLYLKRGNKRFARILMGIAALIYMGVFLNAYNSKFWDENMAIKHIATVNLYNMKQFSQIFTDGDAGMISWGCRAYPENQGAVLGIKEDLNYFNPSSKLSIKCHGNLDLGKRSQLHNIKYWLLSCDNEQSFLEYWEEAYSNVFRLANEVELFPSWSGLEMSKALIYESDVTLGGAWIVSTLEFYDEDNESEIFAWINDPDTKLDEVVSINQNILKDNQLEDLMLLNSENGDYAINDITYRNNSIVYDVSSEKAGILITSEMYDSDWCVYVNGTKETVLNVDYTNRAVAIPSGDSIVKFVYRPKGVVIGGIIQLMAAISVSIYFLCRKRILINNHVLCTD